MFKKKFPIVSLLIISLVISFVGCSSQTTGSTSQDDSKSDKSVTVTDMVGREVTVTGDVDRVVLIEWEAMAAKSMKIMGVADKIVGIDDYARKNTFRNFIIPEFKDAKDIGSAWSGINYESLASIKPDVVFLELWVTSDDEQELHDDCIKKLEDMGIPVVCFLSPSCFDEPNIETAWEHIRLVGKVLDMEKESDKIITSLEDKINLIRERTQNLSEEEKKDVLIFATPNYVLGSDTVQSYFVTEIINANNIVKEGNFVNVSEEQLLKYAPETMVIMGHDGYLNPSIIDGGKLCGINWGNVKEIPALKNKNYISLGYDEWRDTMETPVALLKMAKLIYPDLFADIDIEQEEINMYMNDYGITESEAKEAMKAQHFTGQLEDPK